MPARGSRKVSLSPAKDTCLKRKMRSSSVDAALQGKGRKQVKCGAKNTTDQKSKSLLQVALPTKKLEKTAPSKKKKTDKVQQNKNTLKKNVRGKPKTQPTQKKQKNTDVVVKKKGCPRKTGHGETQVPKKQGRLRKSTVSVVNQTKGNNSIVNQPKRKGPNSKSSGNVGTINKHKGKCKAVFSTPFLPFFDDDFVAIPKPAADLNIVNPCEDADNNNVIGDNRPIPSYLEPDNFESGSELDISLDSDEDDLPDVLHTPAQNATRFEKDELVWVKFYRHPFWPAIIKSVRKNKASICFLGYPLTRSSKGITVNTSKLKPFNCPNREEFINNGPQPDSIYYQVFKDCVQKADDYFRKRGLGSAISVKEFFMEDITRVPMDLPFLNELPGTLVENQSTDEELKKDEESKSSCENTQPRRGTAFLRRVQKLINFITKSKELEEMLIGVYHGTIPNRRHHVWHKGPPSERKKLKDNVFGPVIEEYQQEALINHFQNLYKKCMAEDDSFVSIGYILEVWIPEALIFAIQKVDRLSKLEAIQKFNSDSSIPKYRYSKDEVPVLIMTQEERQENIKRAAHACGFPEDFLMTSSA
ncbi:uncharacterized protein LOC102803790 [Saccoglossus kowalevskii]|uniref:PWWP domain-containing protein MUM1-like n=1 Tax=Saccoglossus kowalevskii TaxID=10224 RepID=A0ABM0MXN7_SACKO|nr:PREDICTED: PWWP domain-containing protein MUM1-like [Saccoglossus kowalevskii]